MNNFHIVFLFSALFLAFIWATFFPAIKRKNQCSSKQIASNEKSWLLKKSAENIACYENKGT